MLIPPGGRRTRDVNKVRKRLDKAKVKLAKEDSHAVPLGH